MQLMSFSTGAAVQGFHWSWTERVFLGTKFCMLMLRLTMRKIISTESRLGMIFLKL